MIEIANLKTLKINDVVYEIVDETARNGVAGIPTAIENALTAAKASGDFAGAPGKDGRDGKDGTNGKDGYTPQKNIDYFDGKDGKDGKDGSDGSNGKTAYQYAVEGGYTGTEADFAAKLASGSSGVSSWNDLTDKPDGVGDSKDTVLLQKSLLKLDDTDYYCELDPSIQFIDGETYEVTWDGAIYPCKAFPDEWGYVNIGNGSFLGSFPDTGEPFVAFSSGEEVAICGVDGNTHEVEIVHTFVQQIEPKYLGICHKTVGCAIPETTYDVPNDGGNNYLGAWDLNADIEIEEGRTYTVTYNGNSYSCVARPANWWIGACLSLKSETVTDFQLFVNAEKIAISTVGIPTVTVKVETDQAYKIDPKYLPDGVGGAIQHKRYNFEFTASELTRDGTFFGVTEARSAELDNMIAEISSLTVVSIGLSGSLPGLGKIIHVPGFCNPRNAALGKNGSIGGMATDESENVMITANGISSNHETLVQAVQMVGLLLTIDVLYS